MAATLTLKGFAVARTGPTLTLVVPAGETLAVLGTRDRSTREFLRMVAGESRPGQGSLDAPDRYWAAQDGLPKRSKVQNLFRIAGMNAASQHTDDLMAARLWHVRGQSVGELDDNARAALELLVALQQPAPVGVLDGQLDEIDPWCLEQMWRRVRQQTDRVFVFRTRQPAIAEWADWIVLLHEDRILFAGTRDDLLRQAGPCEITIRTENQAGVRALVEPFEVRVTECEDGLVLHATEGQAVAAHLLAAGYGDIQFLIQRPRTVREAVVRRLAHP